jgi:hypothetical protein
MVVGGFACCGALIYFWERPLNGIRVEQLEADLEERLPVGSSWELAEEWFASHEFKTYGIVDSVGRRDGLMAIIPNNTILRPGEIHIELYFDANRKLRKRVIYRYVPSF